MSRVVYSEQRDSMSAAHPKKVNMPLEIIPNASRCAKKPVLTQIYASTSVSARSSFLSEVQLVSC
eukprot:6175567-Pleurochrysis_carterae.AAC.3